MRTRTLARSFSALVAVGAVATPVAIAVAPSAHPAGVSLASPVPQADLLAAYAAVGGMVPVPDWANPSVDPPADPPAAYAAVGGMVPVPDFTNPALVPNS
jgi:hypothetical protein